MNGPLRQRYFGAHLGRIYEEQGRQKDAIAIYRMALSARKSAKEEEQIRGRLADLGAGGAEALPIGQPISLSSLSLGAQEKEAVFDVLMTYSGVPSVAYVNGAAALQASATVPVQAAVHAVFPDNGPEKVVRRVRVRCPGGESGACTAQLLTTQEAKFVGTSPAER